MRHPALPFALVVSLVLAPMAAAPARAAEPLWRESQGATAPPDIVRLNNFMHDLSERMKPSLVQVRVRRAPEPAAEGGQEQPGSSEERRSAGSWRTGSAPRRRWMRSGASPGEWRTTSATFSR